VEQLIHRRAIEASSVWGILNGHSFLLKSFILQQLKFHGDPGLLANLTAPWGLSFEATPGTAPFYVVAEGSCFVEVFSGPGESPHAIDLNTGDLVVLTRGDSHHLKSERGSLVRPAYPITPSAAERERIVLNVGAGGTKTVLQPTWARHGRGS
jgi:hypothetical protein